MDMLSSHWLDFNTGRKCVWVFLVGLVFVWLVVFLFPLPVNWKECLSFTYLFSTHVLSQSFCMFYLII